MMTPERRVHWPTRHSRRVISFLLPRRSTVPTGSTRTIRRSAKLRAELLEKLAIDEHGLLFRYIPSGTFLMGSTSGDTDEQPVHAVYVPGFWLSDIPVTWADYCTLMKWSAPPDGEPPEPREWMLENRVRLQYCESETLQATDWHAHIGASALRIQVPGGDPDAEPTYDQKPMVAVSFDDAAALGTSLSSDSVVYGLQNEAEWERAARGGLIGKRYPWGDEPPQGRCDCGHFGDFVVRHPKAFAPNGYGLFGLSGGVSEWTRDFYDALAYHPQKPAVTAPQTLRVLRGGSFVDDAEAVTVSFRMALAPERGNASPTIGFRLARWA
jgi:formylglycine-generating enzyme